MSTIKGTIDNFLYSFIERYTDRVFKDGENTVIHGIKVLEEQTGFTYGALIHAASIVYVHYVKNNDKRCESALKKLGFFIDIATRSERILTWGKLGILRALYKLKKAKLIDNIDAEQIRRLAELTDIGDFLDKERIELIKCPTNYFQVALACSAYREKLGFDVPSITDKIEKKFIGIAFSEENFFMDDELGHGRYDRYSLVLSSEISDLYLDLERPLPKEVKTNLKKCAEYSLFMANSVGDGFNYGRSLSVHGDLTPAEILSSALSRGLIDEDDRSTALSYIFTILEKTLYFWYNSSKDSFDIWWDGRTTNGYRQIHRLLEVNMDMVCHFNALLNNVIYAGYENEPILSKLPYPEEWEYKKIDYDGVHSAYILRYKDYLAMLPFIGTKTYATIASYNPFPAICGFVEGSPMSNKPFLIPEYTDKEGNKLRPAHYVKKIEIKRDNEGLLIAAFGNLMNLDGEFTESEVGYKQEFLFNKNEIVVEFEVSSEMSSAEMFTAVQNESTRILVGGFDDSRIVKILDNDDFKTPHGAYEKAYDHFSKDPQRLGYKINFDL